MLNLLDDWIWTADAVREYGVTSAMLSAATERGSLQALRISRTAKRAPKMIRRRDLAAYIASSPSRPGRSLKSKKD